jgi:polyisoprenoid-binding protein YceI
MNHRALPALLLLITPSLAHARPQTFNLNESNGKKQITFESKAPVEYIEGTAEQVGGSITADFDKPGLGLSASVSVPVGSMRTGVDQRDEHLRSAEWLDADRYPTIRFDLDPVDGKRLAKKGADAWAGTVGGAFTLKGVTKKISVPVTIAREGDDHLIVEGRFPVRLSDHNIHGPLTMRVIGMKVSETVQVAFRLVGVRDKGWDNVKPMSKKPAARAPARSRKKLR